ncbi:bifunctional metallophosphatase/5'-nucleotidase [Sutcliffiella horikoshii]|uniref:bifunctional metallophosphatase/5'-nucleotidase n=1 Tax=Sutcliffiella horikoshii TaxID=79883 RepID=UPI001CFDD27B|nr:bifunctional UDP-sugar hydrolase/5'-nucleotidase [Sutcliffiella horikoshii]
MQQIRILHTNDIHSHFDAYPKLATFLKEQDFTLPSALVDIGDNMDRFHPITEATGGKANTSLLNKLRYDYATFGNNEGITLDYEGLSQLYEEAEFPVLAANLFEENGEYPDWVKPYEVKKMGNVKVAFIGVTVFYQHFYALLGWKIEDPYIMLEKYLPALKEEVDVIVVLSHLGISDDEEMARRFPEIDVILGGHTHHVLPEGRRIGNTLICGAGKYGQYIGQVDLVYNQELKSLTQSTAKLHKLELYQSDQQLTAQIKAMEQVAEKHLNKKVGSIKESLPVEWFAPSIFPNFLADKLREWCQAEIGMVNAGVLLDGLEEGEVTLGMLHRICPHPINPCRVTLTGEELREVVQQALHPDMENLRVKGLGFRGEVMGRMAFSGVRFDTEAIKEGSVQVTDIYIGDKRLTSKDDVTVGTIDMFTFGRMFPSIIRAKEKKFFLPELLRDVLAHSFSDN